jgi:large subunit ribosomal protein L18
MTGSSKKLVERRHKRVRAKIHGTAKRPRLSVSRSNKFIRAQLIDDDKAVTLIGVSDVKKSSKGVKSAHAKEVGKKIAELAVKQGIKEAVFDRGGHTYHGRVKALADGAREGGLKF